MQTVEKFQKLAQLALSEEDGEPTEEARNAAVKAIQMLAEEDDDGKQALLVIPRAEWEKKHVAGASPKDLAKAKQDGMMIGGALGFLFGGGKFGR